MPVPDVWGIFFVIMFIGCVYSLWINVIRPSLIERKGVTLLVVLRRTDGRKLDMEANLIGELTRSHASVKVVGENEAKSLFDGSRVPPVGNLLVRVIWKSDLFDQEEGEADYHLIGSDGKYRDAGHFTGTKGAVIGIIADRLTKPFPRI